MELNHIEFGAGRPVVILHGLFGSARNWSSVARRLGATCRVLAVDLRNHGASPWAETMTYAEMAADVAGFVAAHGLTRPVVIGHSMGGKVAMTLALDRGETLGGLVVVDTAPAAYRCSSANLVGSLRALDLSRIGRRSEADALLGERIPDAAVRMFLLQNLVAADGGLRWRVNLAAIDAGMEAIAGFPDFPDGRSYAGATLFITGAESRHVKPEHRERIRALFPDARFSEISGAGHWVHADRPDAFARTVRDFLDETEA